MKKKKIGVGIVTYNREHGLRKLYESLPKNIIDELIIVNDGEKHEYFQSISHEVIHNECNLGVGKSKNIALKHLMSRGVEYFFLIEDDIFIKKSSVFNEYISASKKTGIQHFNFSQHGDGNKNEGKEPIVNMMVSYGELSLPLYGYCVGAFSYYTRNCLNKVGLMDECYYNAMEHVDHTISVFKATMHPPFGYFADIPNSWEYIGEETWSVSQSVISSKENYELVKGEAMGYFKTKHSCYPIDFFEKDQNKVMDILKIIKSKYSSSFLLKR
ncbi:hypothetical protein PEC301899_08560 [Pectobacterium carotovorum subsp. carotovorum]|nr:hypothetical protein PEC301899_08560 [Pectobacterium carotovorum subsp. carotovorum]